MSIINYYPANLINAIEQGIIERLIRESLTPSLLFLDVTNALKMEGKEGEKKQISKNGLLTTNRQPLAVDTDPTPKKADKERFDITLGQHADTMDSNLVSSWASKSNEFITDMKTLLTNAGMTMNRVIRQYPFRAYLAGRTTATGSGSSSTSLAVESCNGFRTVMSATLYYPLDVSLTNKLAVTVNGVDNNVVACTPTDSTYPDGPGVLTLENAATWSQYDNVIAADASYVVRPNSRASSQDIVTGDKLDLASIRLAVANLKNKNVPKFEDGFFHMHITPTQMTHLFEDADTKRALTGGISAEEYKRGVIGKTMGCLIFENTELPHVDNVDTGANSSVDEVGGILTNKSSINIQRAIIFGKDSVDERWVDQREIYAQAQGAGDSIKVGNFQSIGRDGLGIYINRVFYILRPPMDRLQRIVAQTWSCIAGYGCQTDSLVGGSARYKRACVIETAEA